MEQAALRVGMFLGQTLIQRQTMKRHMPRLRERHDGVVPDEHHAAQITGAEGHRLELAARQIDVTELTAARIEHP